MKIGVKVGDVMTRNFVSAKPMTNLTECAKVMINKKVGSLIIKEKDMLRGLLTSRDILKAIVEKKEISGINAEDIMAKKVTIVKPQRDIHEALMIMNKRKVRQLPVIGSSDKVIGMITMKDILKIEPTLLDSAIELAEIKESAEKHKATGIRRYKGRRALACGATWIREGQCDECGEYDALYNVDGELLCEECKDEKAE